jgi:MFS family permease
VAHGQYVQATGGPARARVILLFGAVLALNGADNATVGAVAPQLEHALHIGNTKVGLLSSVALLVGAVFVLPVGMLVDRFKRIPILSISIVLWSVATLLSALSANYSHLLLTRLALGAVTASAGPAIASLTGDYFPARERGRIYAYILGGEIAGTAVGFIISGSVASLISWRASFLLLAIPGFFLARELWRTVPEPLRGGQSRLEPGVIDLGEAVAASRSQADAPAAEKLASDEEPEPDEIAHEWVRQRGVSADPDLVLKEDPNKMSLTRAITYTLKVPTNLLLIIGSALGYFFFSGLQTFALLFVRGHYHASQATAELVLAMLVLGALVGTIVGGRLTDSLLRRGVLEARIYVPAVCYLGSVVLLLPGFISTSLTPALWFDVAGAALLSAANPGLDAARLDIMPSGLWGRAESARTFLRSLAQALAPLLFGGLSELIAGIAPAQTPVGTHPGLISPSEARGLEIAFVLLLASLAAAGVVLLRARVTYPRDVATAAASQEEMQAATDQAAGVSGDTAPGTDVARSGTGAVVPGGPTPVEPEDDADEGPTMVM